MGNKEIYKELRKTLTPEEIADAFVFPSELTEEQQKESNEKMKAFIKERRKNMTLSDKLKIRYFSFKYKVEDWVFSIKNKLK